MPTVLLVGGTGRTGSRVLRHLLEGGCNVRAIVRSRQRLPAGVADAPTVTLVEASLLSLSDEELRKQVSGCDAVVSCLGHTLTVKGIFGPPRDLVTRATRRLCRQIEALEPSVPVKFILMTSVSVHRRGHADARRGGVERAFLWVLRLVLPPARDNQRAADFLVASVGDRNPFIEWVVVRPDTLRTGETSEYKLHEGLVNSLFRPGRTNMANIASFMRELVVNSQTWNKWKGKLPVIVNAEGEA